MRIRKIKADKKYLLIPVADSKGWFMPPAKTQYLSIYIDGVCAEEHEVILAEKPRCWSCLYLDRYKGSELEIRLENGDESLIDILEVSDVLKDADVLYAESSRPIAHFTPMFSLSAYDYIFKASKTIFRAYGITFFVTAIGTSCNVIMTILLAYPLSRPEVKGRNVIAFLVFFTMLFNGDLVPTYIMYSQIFQIRDSIFALLIPSFLMSPFNVILVRNYFKTNIPESIIEAAKLDGASESRTLTSVVLPMSSPIIGTIGLMSGLAYWNDWTNGLYYLVRRTDLYSIQNVLTNMLNNAQFLKTATQMQGVNLELGTIPSVGIRMAIAVVALIPVMIVYPFIQNSFVKGIVVGGVKG